MAGLVVRFGTMVCTAIFAVAPAVAAPSQNATVKANVVKPLVLTWVQDLDLGTILLKPGNWSNATVSLSRTGTFTCTNTNVACSGPVKVARYRVSGSNNQVVRISAPNVTLVNQSDSSKQLTLTVDRPATITLPNSGQPGLEFALGGSINVSSSTASGVYAGTFNVTVDY